MFLYIWGGLTSDSQGRVFTVGWDLNQPDTMELFEVDPHSGQVYPASPPHEHRRRFILSIRPQ